MSAPRAATTPGSSTETKEKVDTRSKTIPPYHVILLDDDDHTYEYVIEMLRAVFGMSQEKAYLHACEVDSSKRTIVLTTSRSTPSSRRSRCTRTAPTAHPALQGLMSAVIEPA